MAHNVYIRIYSYVASPDKGVNYGACMLKGSLQ